ncbi:alpha-amylase family protein [Corynebacterium sp. A21]|uniref:alpha-amylase family protein n=1 Tax=Corynebacterium sp. A21 TaxID=3457318 RepID=UPI003FD56DF4
MDWSEHTIFWHVYPLGFCGAPIREVDVFPQPRLRKLLNWLDYVVDLGTNALLLGPVFTSQTHGYDLLDQFQIDPRLGTEEDFTELIAAAKHRGLRVILDGVFSHVGREHPDVQQALREGPGSAKAARFDIDWEADGGPKPRVFEGHETLVRLNHDDPGTREHVVEVMNYWLDRGIHGWRLDAAYSVDPEFWAEVLPRVRESHPDVWFLGEVIHGDYAKISWDAKIDSITQYELWKGIWSSLKNANLYELDHALQRHDHFLESFVPQTFIGNHDVTRIASNLGPQGAVTALAILMTVGGVPSIYAGDEQGFTGVKEERVGGDDAVRPAFPDHPSELSPLGSEIHRAHQELIALRRQHPWLHDSMLEMQDLDNTQCRYQVVGTDPAEVIEVSLNLKPAKGESRVLIRDHQGKVLWRQSAS